METHTPLDEITTPTPLDEITTPTPTDKTVEIDRALLQQLLEATRQQTQQTVNFKIIEDDEKQTSS